MAKNSVPDTAITERAEAWLEAFSIAMRAGQVTDICQLFDDECYWRDLLSFTWNIKTLEGKQEIGDFLTQTLPTTRPGNWTLDGDATFVPATFGDTSDTGTPGTSIKQDLSGSSGTVDGWFNFDTAVARGRGHFRLVGDKCHTLLTTMTELKGYEEKRGRNRALGTTHTASRDRVTWLEQRDAENTELGYSRQPYCLVIGGGQGGIALAARLRRLNVPTLVVDKNERAGDAWRNRYRSLVLHDPVWYDHLPYLPFPDDWPVFTPKDKMGDWLEMYARVMELNYWTSTDCIGASFNEKTQAWDVTVDRAGSQLQLHPQQLVLATGAYGFRKMASIPALDKFKGEVLHSSAYVGDSRYRNRKCAVIGCGSSAHDICVDLWENDAQVTMIQRSPSIVVRSETLMDLGFGALYSENAMEQGIDVDTADLLVASVPFRKMPELHRPVYAEIARRDADFYAGLSAAGFLWDFGEDDSGLMMKAMRTASGYYIDVGASQLIIDGEVRVKSGKQIVEYCANGLRMSDGSVVNADVVIHATGYESLDSTIAQLISPEVSSKVGPFWGYGSGIRNDPGPWQGELRNMWKPTNQKGLWVHGGNLHLSRHYSLYLALQIQARMRDIPTPCYR